MAPTSQLHLRNSELWHKLVSSRQIQYILVALLTQKRKSDSAIPTWDSRLKDLSRSSQRSPESLSASQILSPDFWSSSLTKVGQGSAKLEDVASLSMGARLVQKSRGSPTYFGAWSSHVQRKHPLIVSFSTRKAACADPLL